jgi:hypothetical protein
MKNTDVGLDGCFVLVLGGAVLVLVLGLGVSRSITITSTDKAPPEPVNPRLTGQQSTAEDQPVELRSCGVALVLDWFGRRLQLP